MTGENGLVTVSAGSTCDITQTRDNAVVLYTVTAGDHVTLRLTTTTVSSGGASSVSGTGDARSRWTDRTVVATFRRVSVAFEGNDPAETVTSLTEDLVSEHHLHERSFRLRQ